MNEWVYSVDQTTVGSVNLLLTKKRKKKSGAIDHANAEKTGRHVKWDPCGATSSGITYQLIRSGIPLHITHEIDQLHQRKEITENHFYIFKNTEQSNWKERDDTIPLYEAAYYCSANGGTYIRVQKKHLQMAYSKMGRADKTKMWDLMEDETPYWVDRHIFTKLGQRDSKRRYEEKQRRK